MLELRWFAPTTPKCWNFDVSDVIKVTTPDGRLDSLEVASHVVPKLAGCLRQKTCNKLVIRANDSVWGKIPACRVCPERRKFRLDRWPVRGWSNIHWIVSHAWITAVHDKVSGAYGYCSGNDLLGWRGLELQLLVERTET